MEDKNIEIIHLVEKQLKYELGDKTHFKMTDLEKRKVIKQLHARWSHPENEVRKRINSFPEKSPDILKPILEG